jgi:hypothetical protein
VKVFEASSASVISVILNHAAVPVWAHVLEMYIVDV